MCQKKRCSPAPWSVLSWLDSGGDYNCGGNDRHYALLSSHCAFHKTLGIYLRFCLPCFISIYKAVAVTLFLNNCECEFTAMLSFKNKNNTPKSIIKNIRVQMHSWRSGVGVPGSSCSLQLLIQQPDVTWVLLWGPGFRVLMEIVPLTPVGIKLMLIALHDKAFFF